jgi:single-strand DNA-binding protein
MSTDVEFSAPAPAPAPAPPLDAVADPPADGAPNDDAGQADQPVNLVFLTGSLAEPAEPRELAGGVPVVRWTLRVSRPRGQSGSDLLDCVVLDEELKRRALGWPIGLPLSVVGAVRRRFFRVSGRTATRVEIEVERVTEIDAPDDAA